MLMLGLIVCSIVVQNALTVGIMGFLSVLGSRLLM